MSAFHPRRCFRPLVRFLAAASLGLASLAAENRPNIVFIFTDDHALRAIGAYGDALNETPHIDRLADEGMIFTRSYCGNSICGPSRASILTGMHSHRNGFFRNYHLPFDTAQTLLPQRMRDAGYQTALLGKWHLDSTPVGFDHYEVLPDQGHYYNPDFILMDGSTVRHEGYCTDIVTDRAVEWLDTRREEGRPFMLMIQHKAPHRTFAPALRHLDMWKDEELPEPPHLFDDHARRSRTLRANEMEIARHMRWDYDLKVRDFNPDGTPNSRCPEYARMNGHQRAAWDAHFEPLNERLKRDHAAGLYDGDERALTRWKYQRYVKNYLRTVAAVDENVGRVLDHLEASGLAENTVVIYSSDQGFFLGEHGWYDKRWMYEESFSMPFLIRWPGVIEPGRRSDALIQNIDYAPTFLEIAGAEVPERMQGRSLLPLLQDRETEWRDALFYTYFERGEHNVPAHYGVAMERYKLIHFPETGEWNLMDLEVDPLEMRSFHDDPAYRGVMDRLMERYARIQGEYDFSPSTIPVARGEDWWMPRHRRTSAEAARRAGEIDLVFVGDSITQGWESAGREEWERHFSPRGALNLGFSGDRTEHVLWRIKNGAWPAALQPKLAVVMIGTNNSGHGEGRPPEETAAGIRLIVDDIRDRAPGTRILLLSIFPRGETPDDPRRRLNERVRERIAPLGERPGVTFADLAPAFLDEDGRLPAAVMPDGLHPNEEGYRRWAEALLPILEEAGL